MPIDEALLKLGLTFWLVFSLLVWFIRVLFWLNNHIIHVGLHTMVTIKIWPLTLTWIYSSPTSISTYKYIHLHIDMGINLLSCVSGVRYRNHKTLINTYLLNEYSEILIKVNIYIDLIYFLFEQLALWKRWPSKILSCCWLNV